MLFKLAKNIITILAILLLLPLTHAYIDLDLTLEKSSEDISLNFPMTVGKLKYEIGVSLENQEEFIVSPETMRHKEKGKKKKESALAGQIHVSSLEGYTLEGWRRFIMEIIMLENSRYSHTFTLDLSPLKQIEKFTPLRNGIMSLGPNFANSYFYKTIKSKTPDYFQEDIVSFYTSPAEK